MMMMTREAAAGGVNTLSTAEELATALVLSLADRLAERGFTRPEALDRIGPTWSALIPLAAQMRDQANMAQARAAIAARDHAALGRLSPDDFVVDVSAELVTYGDAPG